MFDEDKIFIYSLASPSELSEGDRSRFREVYKRAFRSTIQDCKCKNVLDDALIKLKIFFKRSTSYPEGLNYEMDGGPIYVVDNVAYGRHNITNEIAERLLKERPESAKHIRPLFAGEKPKKKTRKKK